MATKGKQDDSADKQKASTTAILVAAIRAAHLIWNDPPLFSDTYALQMVTPFWRQVAKRRLLKWLIADVLLGVLKPIHTEAILRLRFTEERLREAIADGVGQYVILGAGLDSFSLRQGDLADRLRIFEVDQPASQGMKRERLIAINGSVPDNLVLVPVNFETDRLDEELRGAGFDTDTPTCFSWLGTTYYLTGNAISETLDHISSLAAPGSRIVFDYKYPHDLVPAEGMEFVQKLEKFVAGRGEPMISTFTPDAMKAEMARVGFQEVDSVSPDEADKRYLQGRTDMSAPAPGFSFALFKKQA